ncbi:MAG TPA: hypothetical protein VGN01_03370 [Acidobacteriaceae bacterium]|jgi:hypothetical protein
MARRIIPVVLLCAAIVGVFCFVKSTNPPSESSVIKSFNLHRTEYEQLRVMLQEDDTLVTVADWGVETTDSPLVVEVPPAGKFPVGRFRKYLSLLAAVDAQAAARMTGRHPEARVLVWSSGFAGDTRHVAVGWIDQPPVNEVTSLDTFYKSPKPRNPVYRHIDGHWYIWAGW